MDGFAGFIEKKWRLRYQKFSSGSGTNIPVKVNTVRGSGTICPPANQAYFECGSMGTNHPTNFNGQTKVLKQNLMLFQAKLIILN